MNGGQAGAELGIGATSTGEVVSQAFRSRYPDVIDLVV